MDQVNLRLEHVRLLACTHAHSDHWGQAAPIRERAGCEFWMHPDHAHAGHGGDDRERGARLAGWRSRARAACPRRRSSSSPSAPRTSPPAWPSTSSPTARSCPGVEIETDLGVWTVHHTPGHAPSHVCLYQPEHRLLISGDHVLGRISLFFDYGYSPDPVEEFLDSLDGSMTSTRGLPCPATASRSWTSPATSRATAARRPAVGRGPRRARRPRPDGDRHRARRCRASRSPSPTATGR